MSMHEWSCQKSHWLYNMTYLGKGTTKEKCKHDWRRKIHTYPNDNLAVSIHFIHQKLAPYPFVIRSHIVHSTITHSSIMHTFGIYMEVFMYINRRWEYEPMYDRDVIELVVRLFISLAWITIDLHFRLISITLRWANEPWYHHNIIIVFVYFFVSEVSVICMNSIET